MVASKESSPVATITPHLSSVQAPDALRNLPGWLTWRYEHHEGAEKPRKIPYYANGGKRYGVQGRIEDRNQLTTFEAARAAAARRGFDGVGFALMPDFNVCALDFDHCVVDGKIHPEVLAVVSESYAEYSPSGHGIRAFFLGAAGNHKEHGAPFGFETFSSKGFVTYTGNRLELTDALGNENTVAPITPTVRALCAKRFAREVEIDTGAVSSVAPLGLTPAQIDHALDTLDPDMGHDQWLAVGMALHHETQGAGFDLWDTWSSGSGKYPSSELLQQRWASFGKSNDRTVTARSLVHMANGAGAHIVLNGPASAEEFDALEDEKSIPTSAADEFPLEETTPTAAPLKRFEVISALDFSLKPPPQWIIKGLLPKAEVVVLYGESGSGKSFIALDFAMAIATGTNWRGLKTKQGRVVYVAAEGAAGFRNRVVAYSQHNKINLADFPLGIIDAAPNLMLKDDALDVCRSIGKADVIIIDTYAQSTPGANENSGEDMGKALAHCKGIHRATKAVVVLVHHSGKDASKGARGWSGLKAAADAELEVTRHQQGRMLRASKQKDGEDGQQWGFDLQIVNIGVDDDLDPITSCVVCEAEVPVQGVSNRKLDACDVNMLAVINEFAQAQNSGIEVQALLKEAARRMPEPTDGKRDTRKQRAKRSLERLCAGDDASFAYEDELKATIEIL